MTDFTFIDEVPQDYTKPVAGVLQHWQPLFRDIYVVIRKEAKAGGYIPRPPYDLTFFTGLYAFEQYQIVIEYDDIGSPLRMFFPDNYTELMMLLRA